MVVHPTQWNEGWESVLAVRRFGSTGCLGRPVADGAGVTGPAGAPVGVRSDAAGVGAGRAAGAGRGTGLAAARREALLGEPVGPHGSTAWTR